MRRRSKRRMLKWVLWITGVLAVTFLALSLIEIDDVVMAQGIVEPGEKSISILRSSALSKASL